jgi:tetratricopeptide (TPR) repeat protein
MIKQKKCWSLMMRLFNREQLLRTSIISILLLLSGCATKATLVDQTQQQPKRNQTAQDTRGEANNVTQDAIQSRFDPSLVDPMAKRLVGEKTTADFTKAKNLIKQKRYAQAESLLINLIASYSVTPGNTSGSAQSSAYYYLARIYLLQQQLTKALDAIERSLKLNSTNYYAHNLKGVILREQGEFAQAKQAYLLAIKLYSNHPNSHLNLAILADIYLYEHQLALNHYQYYLGLINEEDKKVEGWVLDLKRRMPPKAEVK